MSSELAPGEAVFRAPRLFSLDERAQFAVLWNKSLDPLISMQERAKHSVDACRTLFSGSCAGYAAPVLKMLRERVHSDDAIDRLWALPLPHTTEHQVMLARDAGLVRTVDAG